MNYQLLLKGKSIKDINDILENWYNRTHNLQEAYGYVSNGIQNPKAIPLVAEMIKRTLILSQIITNAQMPIDNNYPSGGITPKSNER